MHEDGNCARAVEGRVIGLLVPVKPWGVPSSDGATAGSLRILRSREGSQGSLGEERAARMLEGGHVRNGSREH